MEEEMLRLVDERYPDWQRVEDWSKMAHDLGLDQFWLKVKPDAVWRTRGGRIIIAECYARVERLLPGNERKLAEDALKLLAILNDLKDRTVSGRLVVTGEVASKLKTGGGWLPTVLRRALTIEEVNLTEDQRSRLDAARIDQGKGQAAKA
jgi:hypothetical protein